MHRTREKFVHELHTFVGEYQLLHAEEGEQCEYEQSRRDAHDEECQSNKR